MYAWMVATLDVLPARAGMIPIVVSAPLPWLGAPRASGDDPTTLTLRARVALCSPRERG